jgi:hypothetical protein
MMSILHIMQMIHPTIPLAYFDSLHYFLPRLQQPAIQMVAITLETVEHLRHVSYF